MNHFIGPHIDLDNLSIWYRKQGENMAYHPFCKFSIVALKLAEGFRYKGEALSKLFPEP